MKKYLLAFLLSVFLFVSPVQAANKGVVTSSPVTEVTMSSSPEDAPVALNPGSDQTPVIHASKLVEGSGGILSAVLAFVAFLVYGLLSKLPIFNKLVTKEQYQKLLNPLLDEAVAFGVGRLDKADWLNVETKNEALATAVNYVIDHGGDLLKRFGISKEALQQKLEAKLVANGWDTHPGQWVAKNAE